MQTIREDDELGVARQLMLWTSVRHLPVLRGSRVVGIVSDRDLLSAAAGQGASAWKKRAGDVMHREVLSIEPEEEISIAASRMSSRKIGSLPVISNGELVGIVTSTDLLADRGFGPLRRPAQANKHAATARDLMTVGPDVAAPENSLFDAASRMAESGFRHIPVVDDAGKLIGMVSDRDVRTAIGDPIEALRFGGEALDELTVGSIMSPSPVSLSEDASLHEIVEVLGDERIGAVPIVDAKDRPVGIVSYVDVLAYLPKLLET